MPGVPRQSRWQPADMLAQLRALVAAFTFLTRIPVIGRVAHDANDLPRSLIYFPIVGAVVGAIGAVTLSLAASVWTPLIAVLLSVGATVLVTGAFHEDALADSFDGFGGGWNAQQVLEIMKDSRVGSYALVGMILVLATKIAALFSILDASRAEGAARALIAAHVLGRWSSVVLMSRLRYVRADAVQGRVTAGGAFAGAATPLRVVIATIIAIGIVVIALPVNAAIVVGVSVIVMVLGAWYFVRRIGGITGDALGALNQIVELSVYLTIAALL